MAVRNQGGIPTAALIIAAIITKAATATVPVSIYLPFQAAMDTAGFPNVILITIDVSQKPFYKNRIDASFGSAILHSASMHFKMPAVTGQAA